jgi:hypothetical protein
MLPVAESRVSFGVRPIQLTRVSRALLVALPLTAKSVRSLHWVTLLTALGSTMLLRLSSSLSNNPTNITNSPSFLSPRQHLTTRTEHTTVYIYSPRSPAQTSPGYLSIATHPPYPNAIHVTLLKSIYPIQCK